MHASSKVVVRAPATTANLGPGFDVFGMALEHPYDKVTIASATKGIKIEVYEKAQEAIPVDPSKNTAGVVAEYIMQEFSLRAGLVIKIEKGIQPGIGLGSSAASAAAVAFGLNYMFNLKLNYEQLVRFSAKGEVASAGFEHADNVSAAIYGDFIVIKSYNPLEVIHLKAPPNLGVCVAVPRVPAVSKKTEKARSVLPHMVSMDKLKHNVGHAASMAVGFATGNVKLIGSSMSDAVVEPARAFMIPGYQMVKDMALKAGAYGVAISGAGPSLIAIVDEGCSVTSKVLKAMEEGFKTAGISAEVFYTKPGKGVTLLEAE
ncbi:MAG: homoserine kinase [Candidatus Bathycorpusculaceae bacterium]